MHFTSNRCERLCLLLACLAVCAPVAAEDAPWSYPDPEDVRAEALDWIAASPADGAAKDAASRLWNSDDALAAFDHDPLGVFAESCGLIHPELADTARRLADSSSQPRLGDLTPLTLGAYPLFARNNLRLLQGRWLAQVGHYESALAATEGLTPKDVIDPGALLFYRAVALHQLVRPEEGLEVLTRLLERRDDLPGRYLAVADLMQRDLKGIDDESLDHVARRMRDIRQRLALGHAGDRVQDVEREVVDSLDRIIKKMEDEQNQGQQGGGSSSGGSPQSSSPMQDSRPAELRAPGRVAPRELGSGTGWGDLPDKERERAMQQIGREFPAYYQEIIQQYFRELAADPGAEE